MSRSQIFLFFCSSFIAGIFIQSLVNFPQLLWLGFLILGIIMVVMPWGREKRLVVAGFCLILLVGGAWRYLKISSVDNLVNQFNDKEKVNLIGTIEQEPDVRSDNVKYKIKTLAVGQIPYSFSPKIDFFKVEGNILLVAKKYPEYKYGDKIEMIGKLKTSKSSEDFDYRQYLAKDDIYSIVYFPEIKLLASGQGNWFLDKLLAVKNKFENSINKILMEPQSSFLAGLLLGEKRGLPPDLMANFSRTGTTHIIALSGYNITIIAVTLISLFNFFMLRRRLAFWLALATITLFVLMTGAAASVVRAAIMGILVLLAQQVGRLYSIRNALVFAGAVMVYLSPKVLVFDLGFQLSFGATLGLIYISPILQAWLEPKEDDSSLAQITGKKKFVESMGSLRSILIATLAAQIAVLPLLVINFGQLSLIAPVANLLILPFIPATMLLGFLGALGGLIFLPIGQVFGWITWLFLSYEIKIIELLARLPLAVISFKWNWLGGGIYYVILIWLVWRFNRKQKTLVERIGQE